MALWPFRRRSSRKRSRSGAALSDAEGGPQPTPNDTIRAGLKKRRTEPARLDHSARTYSFSPSRNDTIRNERDLNKSQARERPGRPRKQEINKELNIEDSRPWDRTPTLHHDRNNGRSARPTRKKKREEQSREAEIKAMSNFRPVRPATDQWTAGRPMTKDLRRAKTAGLGRHGASRASDVSLPVPGSIHSSLSSDSEFGSYKVSALDVLAPRPTLRYAQNSRWATSQMITPHRSGSQKKRLIDREPIPEETFKSHSRIDSLADDLDASDLRELMERDNRRREQKKLKERTRTERRLNEKIEQQKAEELEAKKSGTPPPENFERGVMGRELVGLGIEPASAVVTSSKPRRSVDSEAMPDTDIGDDGELTKKPPEAFHRTDPINSEQYTPMEEDSRKDTASMRRLSEDQGEPSPGTRFSGILRSVKSRSKSTLRSDRDKMVSPPPDTINEEDVPCSSPHYSEHTDKGGRFSFKSLLGFGGKRQKHLEPSSFSNTSREEMQAAATQAKTQTQTLAKLQGDDSLNTSQINTANYMARKSSSSVPKRTLSRFREDLPELPISPPSSRVQSPDAEPPMPILTEQQIRELDHLHTAAARYDTPTSGPRSIEARYTPSSMERAYVSPSPEAQMSMSMASIDSEGSWLSGNAARKAAIRNSIRRANQREQTDAITDSPTHSTEEDLTITEDEYLSRLTPSREPSNDILGRRSGEGRPSSDEEDLVDDEDMKWGAVGSHPQFVNHRYTMKSVKGLLDIESENEDSESSPISPSSEVADVQRARSVNLGKGHVRNFSAGSAKLLDITPRGSVEDRRSSERRRSHVMTGI